MEWKTDLEFCLTQDKSLNAVKFRIDSKWINDNLVGKCFTINNGFLHSILDGEYDGVECYVDENATWGYIENCLFKLIDTDYKTAKSLDSAVWLCEILGYIRE